MGAAHPATLECLLPARAPLESAALLRFLGARAIPGVEQVEDGVYRRTLRAGKHSGWLTASFLDGKDTLRVEVSASLAPALGQVLARVKRLFDLDADPASIVTTLSADSHLKPLVEQAPGLRLPGSVDGFEQAVRAVLGQQVSVAAARTLAGRIVETFGEPLETPYPALTHLFPTPARLAETDEAAFSGLGITGARIRTLRTLAELVATKALVLKPGVNVEKTVETLLTIPGIGPWTAQYIALRALHWPDAFPTGDLGLLHALNETDPKRLQERAECWRPWRSYAVMHLWHSLETK
ncbi:MAG: DNA-3-methyladenine glycosylase [Armatimonas sp.]